MISRFERLTADAVSFVGSAFAGPFGREVKSVRFGIVVNASDADSVVAFGWFQMPQPFATLDAFENAAAILFTARGGVPWGQWQGIFGGVLPGPGSAGGYLGVFVDSTAAAGASFDGIWMVSG